MIAVTELTRVLGDGKRAKTILDGISFVAPPGMITGLLGPNGAGKTTTMRVLSTLLRPTSGTVSIAGYDVVAQAHEVRSSIGLVTEEPGLYDRLTAREQLSFTGRACGMSASAVGPRIDELGHLLGCSRELDKRCGELSKGNRQKVALLRALVHDPPVLLLDEPTANLDVVATAAIHDLLTTLDVAAGKTVLLSSHSLDEVDRLAQRVVGLVAGRVVVDGTREEIAATDPTGSFRDAFVSLLGQATLAAGEVEAEAEGADPVATARRSKRGR